jgi:hypothetical protein
MCLCVCAPWIRNKKSGVGDPDLDVFGPPGSGSVSQRWSRSFLFLIKVLSGLK